MKKFILQILSVVLFSLSIFSCKNFLNGKEILNQIDKEIEYAQAQNIELLISPDLNTGITIPSGNYTKKVGYSFDISFTPSDDYNFIEWIAIDSKTQKIYDLKEKNPVVTFEKADALSTSVTINKYVDNLLIKPSCTERLKVKNFEPKLDAKGIGFDKDITITFTNKLDKDTVTLSSNEEGTNGSISIVNADNTIEHCEKYFNLSFKNDNVIMLTPTNNIQELVPNSNSKFSFSIKLNANNKQIKDDKGNILIGDLEYFYIINSSMFSAPPEFITLEALNNNNKLEDKYFDQIEDFFTSTTNTYHLNSVDFQYKVFEENDIFDSLIIKERVLYDKNGVDVSNKNYSKENEIKCNSNVENGNYTGTVEYKLDKELMDGIVELTVYPADKKGKRGTPKTYYVIKDTVASVSKIFYKIDNYIYEEKDINNGYTSADKNNIDYYKYFYSFIKIETDTFELFDARNQEEDYGYHEEWITYNGTTYSSDYNQLIETTSIYSVSENKEIGKSVFCIEPDFKYNDPGYVYFKLNNYIDGDKENNYAFVVTDEVGNIYTQYFTYKKAPQIIAAEINEDNKFVLKYNLDMDWFENSHDGEGRSNSINVLYEELDDDNNIVNRGVFLESFNDTSIFEADKKYNCYTFCKFDTGISSVFRLENKTTSTSDTSLQNPQFSVELKPVEKINSNQFYISISAKNYSHYDSMFATIGNKYSYEIKDGNCLIEYKLNPYTKDFSLDAISITITGIKDGVYYKSEVQYPTISEDIDQDFFTPIVLLNNTSSDHPYGLDQYASSLEFAIYDFPGTDHYIKDGKIEITYYWCETSGQRLYLTEDEILKLPNKTITINKDDLYQSVTHYNHFGSGENSYNMTYGNNPLSLYKIPLEEFYEYNKADKALQIYVKVKDNNGNYDITTEATPFSLALEKNPIICTEDNEFYFNWSDENITQIYEEDAWSVQYLTKEDGIFSWANPSKEPSFDNKRFIRDHKIINSVETEIGNSFIRIWGQNGFAATAPLYIDYASADSRECRMKKAYLSQGKVTVTHDRRAFIQTIVSTIDFGDDVAMWERYCADQHKINYKLLTPNTPGHTTVSEYTVNIPKEYADFYKVVVVHYADGTSELFKIK